MGKPKAPKPPDPKETAAAQTGTNVTTALANAQLQNVNQITPDGSLTFSTDPTQTQTFVDPTNGAQFEVPRFTATTELSPEQQAIADQQNRANLGLSTLAADQTEFLQDFFNRPFDGSNEATEARLFELGSKRLEPVLQRQEEQLRTRLANQGIKVGSEAFDRELELQNQSRNDAFNQLLLQGRGQAFSEAQALRNQPINEIGALLGTGQVSQPNFINTNQPSIPTVDFAGLVNENFNQRLNIFNQEAAARQNLLGGLFGLGAGVLSDERAKKDAKRVGTIKGNPIYEYRYKGEPDDAPKSLGVMAQEAEKKAPEAVETGADGLKRVNYGELFGVHD